VLYFVWAGALTHASPASLLLAVAVSLGLAHRMRGEEHLVMKRYGEYRDYAGRTARVVPKLL
jgi:protein-S-isoprenylcysteine O-methyltransferase Ste14